MTVLDAQNLKSLGERASLLILKYQTENERLKKELIELYKRELKLLKIIDKRDDQLALALSGAENKIVARPVASSKVDLPTSDHELLQLRYNALRYSKLGRLQLWYWRRKAGK